MHPVPVPVKSISQLSIQEIEEKQLGEEWPSGDRDSNDQENFFTSVASTSSPNTAINILGSLNNYSERRPQQRLEGEDEEKNGRSMPNDRFSNQLESNQIEQYWTLPGFADTGLRPQTISTDKSNLPASQTFSDVSSATPMRGYLPASFAAPVMVTTAANSYAVTLRPENANARIPTPPPRRATISTCSRRPCLEGTRNTGMIPSASFVAPAVRIRSVVPACSAPPAKPPPSPIQERLFSGVDKNKVESTAEISAQSLDFGKPPHLKSP